MNFKTTYILFGVLVGVLAVFLGFQLFSKKTPDDTAAYVLPSLHEVSSPKADDIETIEIDRSRPESAKLLFRRTEKGWRLEQPDARVTPFLVDRAVDQVIRAQKVDDADMTGNLGRYGLDSPAAVVTITQKGTDKQWKLNIGSQSVGEQNAVVYVTSSDLPQEPMAVRRSDLDMLFKSVFDFRSRDLLADSALDIQYVELQGGGHDAVVLKKESPSDNQWRFEKPPYGDADYEGAGPAPGSTANAPSGVHGLLDALAALKVDYQSDKENDFVEDNAADLARYSLDQDKPEKLRIEVKRSTATIGTGEKTTTTVTLLVGKKVEDKKAEEKKGDDKKADDKKADDKKADDKKAEDKKVETKEEKYYARLAGEKNVVKLSAKSLEPILAVLANPSSLRDRDLVHLESSRVDALNIQNANGLLKLRRGGADGEWKLFRDSAQPQKADAEAIDKLLSALTVKRQVKDFPDPKLKDSDLQLDKPLAVVSVWVDGVDKDEKKEDKKDAAEKDDKPGSDKKDEAKKDEGKKNETKNDATKKDDKAAEKKKAEAEPKLKSDKPAVKLTFGKRDTAKQTVVVRREAGDEKTLLEVPDTLVDPVSAGALAYLDHSLPSFAKELEDSVKDVTRVVLVRGANTFELEKETKDSKTNWNIKEPKDLAGRKANFTAVTKILDELGGLRAKKLIAEKASDSELIQDGLVPPQVKVTVVVTRDNKPEEHVYLFGKEADKDSVYAKQGDRDLLFTAGSGVLTTLRGDLVDPHLYSFDAAKVRELRLSGWKKALGLVATIDLERQAGGDKGWTAKSKPEGFEFDAKKVDDFVARLANLQSEGFVAYKTGPKPEYGLADADRSLVVEVSLESEKEPIKLTIGNLDEAKKGYYAQSSTLPGDVFLLAKDPFEPVLSGIKFFGK